jgi:Flp pilus assembly protein TadD
LGLNGGAAEAIAAFSRAIEQFHAAVRLSPDCGNARSNRGAALAQSGNCTEALRQFIEAIRQRPEMGQVRQEIAAYREVLTKHATPK